MAGIQPDDVRVIWTTPPYANYVWVAHPTVSQADRERIQRAFLKLAPDVPGHAGILKPLGAEAFYPASMRDFAGLQKIAEQAGSPDP